MRWLAAVCCFVFSLSTTLSPTSRVRAQEAAELLPSSTAIYVEIAAPKETLAAVLDHPIRRQLDELPEYKQLFESNEFKQFRLGVGWVELAMTTPWRTAVESLTEGGVYFAADPALGGAAMLLRAKDEATLKRFFDLGVKLVKDDARKKGQDERVKSGEYRGITAHRIDKLRMAAVGRWLVLSDNDEVGKTLLDALLDGNKENLASDAKFKAALAARGGKPAAWAYVRLDDLRDRGFAGGLRKGKADNPAAELIAGGLLSVLQHTPVVTARIDVDATDARLAVQMPIDKQWLPASRSYYFGPDAKGAAPRPLAPPGTILNLTAYRDLGGFWNAAPDLFDEATNSQLVQANSNLSTLFSGQDFGQDVLTT
ncbi:MAG TPA: hypothetical protein PLV92_27690, partial [Pirellulaceae bacterium]|nr:hypothetical protein [Pirellulaceae bacterium]